jgi:hypothetical protein
MAWKLDLAVGLVGLEGGYGEVYEVWEDGFGELWLGWSFMGMILDGGFWLGFEEGFVLFMIGVERVGGETR